MTTIFQTITFALSKFYCRGISKENSAFERFSYLPPMPPPSKTQVLLLLSSRRL